MTAGSVADDVVRQLAGWDHLGPGDIACLVTAARAVDASWDAVETAGAAPLPTINGCRYLADMLRKAAPAQPVVDGGTAGALAEWLED